MAHMKSVIRQGAALPNASLFTSPRLLRAAKQAFDRIHFDSLYVFRIYMTPLVLWAAMYYLPAPGLWWLAKSVAGVALGAVGLILVGELKLAELQRWYAMLQRR